MANTGSSQSKEGLQGRYFVSVMPNDFRDVPDQDFQNPAGTGFTGFLRGISGRNLPDNLAIYGFFSNKKF